MRSNAAQQRLAHANVSSSTPPTPLLAPVTIVSDLGAVSACASAPEVAEATIWAALLAWLQASRFAPSNLAADGLCSW